MLQPFEKKSNGLIKLAQNNRMQNNSLSIRAAVEVVRCISDSF